MTKRMSLGIYANILTAFPTMLKRFLPSLILKNNLSDLKDQTFFI